jgi:spermidine/putrescine transport system substrate-binding protein
MATVEATAAMETTTEAVMATMEATTAMEATTEAAMATMEATTAVAMATADVLATEAPAMATSDAEATAEGTAAAPMESTWTCPGDFSGQTLSVYNWADYIGETTIQDFEKLCDVTVNYEFFENNEQVISRLRQGNPGYDVIFANTYAIEIMIRDGLVEKIDKTKIPNFKNISSRWLNMPHDPNNDYSVPYLWGSMGVAYDNTKVTEPIDSWEDVFNHDGPVAWLEDQRAMLGVALKILGYDNSSTNPEEIQAAKDYLIEKGKNVKVIAADDGQALLERGEVDIAIEYSGDIYQLGVTCGCDRYVYVIPKEGSVADMAAALVPTDAPNPELAYAFIDYLNDPVVNAEIVTFVAYGTTNQAAIDSGIIPQAMLETPSVFLPESMLSTMFFTEDVGEAEQAYNDAWDELKINLGK